MKNSLKILILIFGTSICLLAQTTSFNSPVSQNAKLACKVITPLSIDPRSTNDYICWPTIPIGSKYTLGQSNRQNADFNSIFTFSGEPEAQIQISVTIQTTNGNVEISYRLKGTPFPYLGIEDAPLLNLTDGKVIVSLSDDGVYYLHIVYDWVWAHSGATKGVKHFAQSINAQYYGL